jgi:parvulin-like peptidyl-prolyl isomerase
VNATRVLRASAVAVVAAGVLAVSGCATADTAAVVNGERISETEVQKAVTSIKEVVPNAQIDTATALQLLVYAPFVVPVANRAGKGVSDSQVRASMDDTSGRLNEAALELIRTSDLLNPQNPSALDQQEQNEAIEALHKADVTVNPRYGTFDPKRIAFDASTPNWIKQPSTPTATSTPQG